MASAAPLGHPHWPPAHHAGCRGARHRGRAGWPDGAASHSPASGPPGQTLDRRVTTRRRVRRPRVPAGACRHAHAAGHAGTMTLRVTHPPYDPRELTIWPDPRDHLDDGSRTTRIIPSRWTSRYEFVGAGPATGPAPDPRPPVYQARSAPITPSVQVSDVVMIHRPHQVQLVSHGGSVTMVVVAEGCPFDLGAAPWTPVYLPGGLRRHHSPPLARVDGAGRSAGASHPALAS